MCQRDAIANGIASFKGGRRCTSEACFGQHEFWLNDIDCSCIVVALIINCNVHITHSSCIGLIFIIGVQTVIASIIIDAQDDGDDNLVIGVGYIVSRIDDRSEVPVKGCARSAVTTRWRCAIADNRSTTPVARFRRHVRLLQSRGSFRA